MFSDYHKCKTEMNSDNSLAFGDCPKPKKSKPSECEDKNVIQPNWAHLPSVVIHEIFDLLDKKDRQNAASVCKNWRQSLFHPRWWTSVTFEIEPNRLDKSKFCTSVFGRIVANAKIKLNTLHPECNEEFILLLEQFTENYQLKELIVEPTHCRFDLLPFNLYRLNRYRPSRFEKILKDLDVLLPSLRKFSIGCLEDFSHYLDRFLVLMKRKHPENVTHLGLASVKEIPDEYEMSCFEPELIKSFVNLKFLSIDFDQLSDVFLSNLNPLENLKRLVVHLHGVREGHPGTSELAWKQFNETHPKCELRLTIIHSYDEINVLHEKILRKQMPLTHLKVFFCEMINLNVLEYLPANYSNTLKSLMWIDSFSNTNNSWLFTQLQYEESPDPLILVSWLCKNLEEIVLYGYKYFEDNLIAIARLRGDKLNKLELAEDDVLFSKNNNTPPNENALIDIPLSMKKPWAPIKTADLHPVIRNPLSGDSDEYLLPIVLADLH